MCVVVDDAKTSGLRTYQLLCQTLHLLLENDILFMQMLCLPIVQNSVLKCCSFPSARACNWWKMVTRKGYW